MRRKNRLRYPLNILNKDIQYKDYTIGDYTYGKPIIHKHKGITLSIGKFCSFANNVNIFLGNEHKKYITTSPLSALLNIKANTVSTSKGNVIIKNDVWIGFNTVILSGITIGNGVIIGANSIITKNVPDYAIVIGANIIKKYRFNPQQIQKLLEIKWWDWDINKIKNNIDLLLQPDIDLFLKELK
jgi:virginiamycin A acetyltransferase